MPKEKNIILVPIDISEQSLIALSQSYKLAESLDAEIALLYVIEEMSILAPDLAPNFQELEKAGRQFLEELAQEKQQETNISFSVHITHGKPPEEITDSANKNNATLIVMGTYGMQNIGQFTGSTTLQVLQTANCPVLCIGGKEHKNGCDNILLPLDLTKETSEKIEHSIAIAQFFKATIYLLSIIQDKDKDEVNRLVQQLDKFEQYIESKGVKCMAELIERIKGTDTFGKNIVNYAERISADLIVIMAQQEHVPKNRENNANIRHVGGAAQEIISNSAIPVLAIPPTK